MDRHEEGFLMLTLFPHCLMCFMFSVHVYWFVLKRNPPEERQWRDELFPVVSKQRLIPKNQPLYIYVHGYREQSGGISCPLAFPI